MPQKDAGRVSSTKLTLSLSLALILTLKPLVRQTRRAVPPTASASQIGLPNVFHPETLPLSRSLALAR